MAVKLRLMRVGKKNRPLYRVIAVDSRRPRDSEYLECVGHYDPYIEDDLKKFRIDKRRVEYWLSVGARPTETVLSFLRKLKVSGLIRPKRRSRRRRAPVADERRKPKA